MIAIPLTVTPLSVAPMMDWTGRHERFFLRQISRHVRLYTEMITTGAILHGDRARLLAFNADEHPVALQIGGADPAALAECARIGADFGYDEINLNIGCPSDRVQSGDFGACLMAKPELVARAVEAMAAAVDVPVTVKHRIAIDDQEEWPTLSGFVQTVAAAGCRHFIVHARKAWLQGLSAKENREVPPLRYELVHQLKQEFPALGITINGGFITLDAAAGQLALVDGVMIGREAYQNPYVLAEADRRFFGGTAPVPTRLEIVERMLPYAEQAVAKGVPLKSITRHILGLFNGQRGARAWRRYLSENAPHFDGGPAEASALLRSAAAMVPHGETAEAAA
jgi:tRNA-dihydrouridine synthase A